jgi:hypothetical protein
MAEELKSLGQPKRIELTDDVVARAKPVMVDPDMFIGGDVEKPPLPFLPGADPPPQPWSPNIVKSQDISKANFYEQDNARKRSEWERQLAASKPEESEAAKKKKAIAEGEKLQARANFYEANEDPEKVKKEVDELSSPAGLPSHAPEVTKTKCVFCDKYANKYKNVCDVHGEQLSDFLQDKKVQKAEDTQKDYKKYPLHGEKLTPAKTYQTENHAIEGIEKGIGDMDDDVQDLPLPPGVSAKEYKDFVRNLGKVTHAPKKDNKDLKKAVDAMIEHLDKSAGGKKMDKSSGGFDMNSEDEEKTKLIHQLEGHRDIVTAPEQFSVQELRRKLARYKTPKVEKSANLKNRKFPGDCSYCGHQHRGSCSECPECQEKKNKKVEKSGVTLTPGGTASTFAPGYKGPKGTGNTVDNKHKVTNENSLFRVDAKMRKALGEIVGVLAIEMQEEIHKSHGDQSRQFDMSGKGKVHPYIAELEAKRNKDAKSPYKFGEDINTNLIGKSDTSKKLGFGKITTDSELTTSELKARHQDEVRQPDYSDKLHAKINPSKEKAALRVRKAIILSEQQLGKSFEPVDDITLVTAYKSWDAIPDLCKSDRMPQEFFTHALERASMFEDKPLDFIGKIWYGDTAFEKMVKDEKCMKCGNVVSKCICKSDIIDKAIEVTPTTDVVYARKPTFDAGGQSEISGAPANANVHDLADKSEKLTTIEGMTVTEAPKNKEDVK